MTAVAEFPQGHLSKAYLRVHLAMAFIALVRHRQGRCLLTLVVLGVPESDRPWDQSVARAVEDGYREALESWALRLRRSRTAAELAEVPLCRFGVTRRSYVRAGDAPASLC